MRYREIINEAITAPSTPAFQNWFKGSKVVDKAGAPLVCYHGTFFDFAKFQYRDEPSLGMAGSGYNRLGFWFDVDPATPNYFAGYHEENGEPNSPSKGVVYPCFLSIKKPLIVSSEWVPDWDLEELRAAKKEFRTAYKSLNDFSRELRKRYGLESRESDYTEEEFRLKRRLQVDYDEKKKRADELYDRLNKDGSSGWYRLIGMLPGGVKATTADVAAYQQEIISEGYDGIHFPETAADFGSRDYALSDWWVAFHPNQIKSAFAKDFRPDSDHMSEGKTR